MNQDAHARARQRIAAARVEGIPSAEQAWLEQHLEECAACAHEAAQTRRALESLRWAALRADPEMVRVARVRVRLRIRELDERQGRLRWLWASCALATVLATGTLPLLWSGFAWLSEQLHLPNGFWQVTLLTAWFLPALVIAAVLARPAWARSNGRALPLRGERP